MWKDSDQENPSVQVSIPIIQSQRNIYKATAQHPREVSVSAISLETNELDINQFALRSYKSREATWEPAKPSLIASQGWAPQIPCWQSKNENFTPSANSSVARKGSERVVGKDEGLSTT